MPPCGLGGWEIGKSQLIQVMQRFLNKDYTTMSEAKINLQISKKLIKELFDIAKLPIPNTITDHEIQLLINVLRNIYNNNPNIVTSMQDIKDEPKNILVVDDLGLVVYQLSLILTKNNYNVILARSEPEALNIFNERGPFEFVIMDLFMPEKQDGINLLTSLKKLVRQNNLPTRIFIMSVSKDKDTISELFSLGADNFIEKSQDWKSNLINSLNNV